MKVKIWGARGSIPTPMPPAEVKQKIMAAMLGVGKVKDEALREKLLAAMLDLPQPSGETAQQIIENYLNDLSPLAGGTASGNTPCVEVTMGRNLFIIDAGSGIRELGLELMRGDCGRGKGVIHLLFSHPHWDHIQGFPFFRPAFIPGNKITVYSVHDMEAVLRRQQEFINFPVPLDYMAADLRFQRLAPDEVLYFGDSRIRLMRNNHPGDAYSFRFEKGNKSFVYASDASYPQGADLRPYTHFFSQADVLIFDTQFTQRESDDKEDWGHSSSFIGVELAQQAQVKTLLLYHYDPTYADKDLEKILTDTLKFQENQYPTEAAINIMIAKEGQVFDLTPPETTHLEHLASSDVAILTPTGIFNDHVAADLRSQVAGLQANGFPSQLIIDLSKVEVLQVAGLRTLVKLRKENSGASIVLAGPSINVQQLIELAGYLDFFAIYPSTETALEMLQSRKRANLPGQTIKGRYYLEEKLGDSRLGMVFKATDLKLKRAVAVKILSPSFSEGAIEQFIKQARQLTELNHVNIAHIFDCDEEQGLSFMVEEFVEGQTTLTDLLQQYSNQPLPLDLALGIAERVTQALDYAHSHGVVHGDLKPKNILLNNAGLKISDFGLGRLESGKSLLNIDVPLALVTAAYLAPEQVLGHPLDARTDIYALGVILYQLFSGYLPFTGSDKEVMEAHLSSTPPLLRELNPNLSLVLEHLILKMLDKDPHKRYAHVRQIRHILANINPASGQYSHHPTYPRQHEPQLINRLKPMQRLQKLWQQTQQGQGQLIFITAETGLGKNRLLHEFAHQLKNTPFFFITFDSHKQHSPYLSLIEAMQDYLRRGQMSDSMQLFSQKLMAAFPPINYLFDPKVLETPVVAAASNAPLTTLTAQLQRLLSNLPMLLIWEDLHLADTSSLYLLDYLARCCYNLPLMIIVSYCHTDVRQNPFLEEILKRHAINNTLSLTRFNKEAVQNYLHHYWSSQVPAPLIEVLAQRSQGNPMYLEQLIYGLVDEGIVTYQNNQWHFETVTVEDLPATLQEIIPRRVKRLSKEIQTLLSQAAILGQQFKLTELLEISYLPEKNVLESLDIALERQLIKADPCYNLLRFSHAAIRQAFYQKLSPLERRRIHFEAGEVLERLYNGQKMSVAPLLAHHFLQAGDYERVLIYSRAAAQQAELLQNNSLALTWYNTTWQAMTELNLPAESKPEFELLLAREHLYKRLGQREEQKQALTSLAQLIQSSPTPDPKKQALVAHRWSAYQRLQNQWEAAQVEAQASLSAAQQANDPILRGESLIQLGYLALAQGQFEVARKELDTAYTILSQAHNHVGESRALNGLGMICQAQNEFAQAESYYQQALTLNQTTRDWANQATALANLGGLYLATSDLAKAEIYSQRALEINRLISYPSGITHCNQILNNIKMVKA